MPFKVCEQDTKYLTKSVVKRRGISSVLSTSALLLVSYVACINSIWAQPASSDLTTEIRLFDFENGKVPEFFNTDNATLAIVDASPTLSGRYALKALFNNSDHPQTAFKIQPQTPFNWRQYKDFHLAFDVTNQGHESINIDLIMGDSKGKSYTRSFVVAAGGTATYYAKMDGHDQLIPEWASKTEFNFASGFRSNPPTWESKDKQVYSMWGAKQLYLGGITHIAFIASELLTDRQLTIDNIRLRPNPEMNKNFLNGLIDRFGQNAKKDYAGKVKSEAHLKALTQQELSTLTGEIMNDRSTFHGWKEGPKYEATGYFRTQKIADKWALIDPEGYLYFSSGIDIIRLSNSSTMTGYDFDQAFIPKRSSDLTVAEDDQPLNRAPDEAIPSRFVANDVRANVFSWLPEYKDALGNHFGYRRETQSGPLKHGETYSFYSANLERRYGETYPESYLDTWREVTIRRMQDWGYTSLGNWSQESYYGNNRIPFVAFADIIGEFGTLSSGFDFWHGVPDAYDPRFYDRAVIAAQHVASQINNSPWCMGVFMDNEQSFGRSGKPETQYGIVLNTLKLDASSVPAKAAFTASLKKKYNAIGALNKAWDKSVESWDAFSKGIDASINTEQQIQDYSQLLYEYGVQYFGTVNKALKSVLPHHLYLGSRLPGWGRPMEILRAAAANSDIITYNLYDEGLAKGEWTFLEDIDSPSLIGEFAFGAADAGHVHPGLVMAADQKDRGYKLTKYMESVIDNPYFVGAHYFQYSDSAIAGRAYDGENYNNGMVRVTDVPYEDMVNAMKNVHKSLYERRYGHLKEDKK